MQPYHSTKKKDETIKPITFGFNGWLFLILTAQTMTAMADDLQPVTVQLNWKHQFEYAAFYAALEQGYYREVGLDVTLLEGGPGIDSVGEVIKENADFGVANSSLLIERYKGKPVVALAALMQHSAIMLLARRDHGIESVKDIENKPISISAHARNEILAFLLTSGLDKNTIHFLDHPGWDARSLLTADFAACEIYETNETYWLRGHEHEFILFTPRSAGIDLFGNILFTSDAILNEYPEIVGHFRQATLKGLAYAFSHQQQLIDSILERYNTQHKTRDHLLFEAQQLEKLLRLDLVESGYMSPERWKNVRDVYASLGLLPENFDLSHFIYQANPQPLPVWLKWTVAALTFALSAALIISLYFNRLNQRLQREVADRIQAENNLKQNQDNFRVFVKQANQLLSHELRTPLAVIKINLDSLELKNAVSANGSNNMTAIRQSVLHLQELFGDKLKQIFSATQLASNSQELNVETALKDNISAFNTLHNVNHLQVKLALTEPLITLMAADMFKTICFNLLDNAIKYSPGYSDIIIQLTQEAGNAALTITNISRIQPLKKSERLFNQGNRGKAPKSIAGTGMGLYLVRLIIEAHGGQISAHTSQSRLFVVKVTLPLANTTQ